VDDARRVCDAEPAVAELTFRCLRVTPDPNAASPTLVLRLGLTETTGADVHAVVLRCQIQLEPHRREYADHEVEAVGCMLGDRSGRDAEREPLRFGFATQTVSSFTGSTEVDLPVPCSYDLEVAANQYMYALDGGVAPLLLLFSGTVFTTSADGLSVHPVARDSSARFSMPVSVWRAAMDLHFPGKAWLRLRRETFDALHRYRARRGLLSWDDAVERLLKEAAP
jgi:hypothetical protein